MSVSFKVLLSSFVLTAAASPALAQTTAAPPLQYAKQGWTADERQAFYTTSQGSHMMPYLWFKALRRLDADEPFGGDQLQRYGYLSNEKSKQNPEGLPVGFVIDGDASTGYFGMTCAACHTAEIEYQKDGATQRLRIDGAPATANFQLFLTELTAASRATLNDADRFQNFAHAVLGSRYSPTRTNELKTDFAAWVKQFGDFMDKSLPASPWGPARLDAFGMIFNRVAGKDLNIPDNIKIADAPVSYPFLWNASRQDKTQWNGGVPNGLYINAIGRNTGEVFGVFADFAPRKQLLPPHYNFRNSSVNFTNLQFVEEKIAALRPPPWPFPSIRIWSTRAACCIAQYAAAATRRSGCRRAHGSRRSVAVGTDPKMFDNALTPVADGHLGGRADAEPAGLETGRRSGDQRHARDLRGRCALAGNAFPPLPTIARSEDGGVWLAIRKDLATLFSDCERAPNLLSLLEPSVRENVRSHDREPARQHVQGPGEKSGPINRGCCTASGRPRRTLHNGSVPNLWELLLPPGRRSASFMVGSRKYDTDKVGYVTTKSPYKDGTLVVGAGAAPGNSNAGHDYTKDLNDDQRRRCWNI